MKKIRPLLAIALVCLVIGCAIYAFALPVRYESRATVMIQVVARSTAELQGTREAAMAEEIAALKGLDLAEAVGLEEEEIVRGLRVKPRKDSGMIDISFRHRDPETPAKALVELLRAYLKDFHVRHEDRTFESQAEERDRARLMVQAGELDESVLRELDERAAAEAMARLDLPNVQVIQAPSAPVAVRRIL